MANTGRLPQRMRRRDVSLPLATTIVDGKDVIVRAKDVVADIEANGRVKGKHFFCPICKGEVYVSRGKAVNKPNPGPLDVAGRMPARFNHMPGTAFKHIQTQTNLMAGDVLNYLYQLGERNSWNPEYAIDGPKDVWMLHYNTNSKGEAVRKTFIVSANPTKLIERFPEAIVITTSSGNVGNVRRLTLYNEDYKILSPARLKDYVAKGRLNRLHVSGYFARDATKRGEGNEHFVAMQIKLSQAVGSIVDGLMEFVEGIDRVSGRRIESGAKFGLFNIDQVPVVHDLVVYSRRKFTPNDLASRIADTLGLSMVKDSSTVASTSKYRFGNASRLYVSDNEGNLEGLVHAGQRTILIGLDPYKWNTPIDPKDLDNCMIITVNAKKDYEFTLSDGTTEIRNKYKELNNWLNALRSRYPNLNVQYRDVGLASTATREAKKFLGAELLERDKRANGGVTPSIPVAGDFEPLGNWEGQQSLLAFDAINRQ
jgi:hypothetical protein